MSLMTPQRPLPGAYLQTPARRLQDPSTNNPFSNYGSSTALSLTAETSLVPQSSTTGTIATRSTDDLRPVERASKTVNDALAREAQYPELDAYISQGVSADYDVSSQPSWAPFQKVKVYDVPEKLFEQYNRAQISTLMGLFAELNHAWVSIDNALYLWDYTQLDPPLIGFEEQSKQITAVDLLWPRVGVFVQGITRLLVVATTSDLHLVGLASQPAAAGGSAVTLYSTGMQVSCKGIEVSVLAGSASTGRIFFGGRDNDDVYELTYQQEERWFQNRCGKINHTGKGISVFSPALGFGSKSPQEHLVHMVVDDTRSLLYTLSSQSTIRVFHLTANNGLSHVINRPLSSTLRDISHMPNAASDLMTSSMSIVAIEPITSQEAARMHLVATTSTGCRIFLSATSSSSFYSTASTQSAPNSMQVQHVKFPPADSAQPQQPSQPSTQMISYTQANTFNNSSRSLLPTRLARRFAPGYFFCFVPTDPNSLSEKVFVSGPDSGRIARPPDAGQRGYPELGMWVTLGARAEGIGSITAPFAAGSSPRGFANELTVQFDKPTSEIAVLTNVGVNTYRKRRLVDIFAASIRGSGGDEGLENEIKKFIRRYGRGETASTALAVACGQGLDVTVDSRVASITEPDVLEYARKAFIEYGGKPQFYENNVVDQSVPAIDMVHPSPRHEGLSLYVTRLVRSIWKAPIVQEATSPLTGLTITSPIPMPKLQRISQDLLRLKEFLDANRSFIDGLSGPDALRSVNNKPEEISLRAEHRALHSQMVLIDSIIEGIAFVQVLFDERIQEIILSLSNETREKVRGLTYEALFCTPNGRDIAKELVKAIVNRNIANGSNVETVAEALRRRCGSFCSSDDVITFKAQEQLKRASETGDDSEFGRNLLNESLRLFIQVASSLSMEQLQWALSSFSNLQFYAGAIQLALAVAHECDRGNMALSWIEDGRPEGDPRIAYFDARKRCYNLIHDIVDTIENTPRDAADNQFSLLTRRKNEAYEVIDSSEDEAFQTDLYDWYLSQHKIEHLLRIRSPYIVKYLERRSKESVEIADLLWRYHSGIGHNHEAANVQLRLAESQFTITLDARIAYLGQAKANASMPSPGVARQTRYQLLREVTDLLEIASLQHDILQRLQNDARVAPDRRGPIMNELNGPVLPVTILYNEYAEQASYYDLCILIYQAADHRNPADIRASWQNLINHAHEESLARIAESNENVTTNGTATPTAQPFEAVAEKVRSLGTRLNLSDTMFPIPDLLPMLERYAFTEQRGIGPATWVVDTFQQIGVPCETLYAVLEGMFYNDEQPFHGRNRRIIAHEIVYVVRLWFQATKGGRGGKVLGGEQNAMLVSQMLGLLQQNGGLDRDKAEECAILRVRIENLLA